MTTTYKIMQGLKQLQRFFNNLQKMEGDEFLLWCLYVYDVPFQASIHFKVLDAKDHIEDNFQALYFYMYHLPKEQNMKKIWHSHLLFLQDDLRRLKELEL